MIDVLIKTGDGFVPKYSNFGDAGVDLVTTEDFTIEPGCRHLAKTGISIALPDGYAAFVHPRSGLALKSGITVVNAPGTIDAGYHGEIMVCLLNTDKDSAKEFKRGDRIAQLVVQKVEHVHFVEVEELPESLRGTASFGSTGC
ncbi:MAG: dUTP diphosphatase [Candidatus Ancillula trichonymphae]|jgi:dUTP pyrophosphatase|nr:dUTP diphosphatase [Candidatus Ancillula trichonymphae]